MEKPAGRERGGLGGEARARLKKSMRLPTPSFVQPYRLGRLMDAPILLSVRIMTRVLPLSIGDDSPPVLRYAPSG